MSNAPTPQPDAEPDVLHESAVDRALWAYLDESTAASQSALADAAGESDEARAELDEFLAADAELQQLVGALGPLAASMLRPQASERTVGGSGLETAELRLTPAEPAALEEELPPAPAAEPLVVQPSGVQPRDKTSRSGLLRWLIGAAAGLVLVAGGGALWLYQPPAEKVHTPGDPTLAPPGEQRPRRPFAASADLWKPLVAEPGMWRYRLGEEDARAKLGALMPQAMSAPQQHPLSVLGSPRYAAGFAPGSTLAAELAPGSGWSAPVVTPAVDNFCAEAWFKLHSLGKSTVLYVGHGGLNGFGLLLHDNAHAGRITYMGLYGGVRFLDTNVTAKVDEPVHLAVVRASGQTTVYLNGKAYPFGDLRPNPADGVMNIGGSLEFNGQVDEARVWVFPPGGFKESDLLYR